MEGRHQKITALHTEGVKQRLGMRHPFHVVTQCCMKVWKLEHVCNLFDRLAVELGFDVEVNGC